MNNVGALAVAMPIGLKVAARLALPPGKVLMPMAFGSMLGGMTTLIGTPRGHGADFPLNNANVERVVNIVMPHAVWTRD